MKPILHIAHANGFPGASYATLAQLLSDEYEVHAFDRFGHNPDFPVTEGWPKLEEELIGYLESFGRPVIALGHSLGGVLSLKVAIKRPDLVQALIMLDSPLLTGLQELGLGAIKRLGLIDRVTGGARAEQRRNQWPDFESARQYLSGKRLFSHFDPRCMDDYVRAGTVPSPEGLQLFIDRDVEAAIFRSLPGSIWIPKDFGVPAAVIGGTQSDVVKPANARVMRKKLGMKVRWIEGGHMFPFEKPDETVKVVKKLLNQLI